MAIAPTQTFAASGISELSLGVFRGFDVFVGRRTWIAEAGF
jgi:hypothetical protein